MQAFIAPRYGSPDVLQLREVDPPTLADNQALVKIRAASLNAYDWHLLTADIFLVRLMNGGFFRPPKPIPGADIAGVVEAVGAKVTRLHPGDAIFGDISSGGFAEYAAVNENRLAHKPENLSFEEAAAAPMAALTALHGLREDAQVQAGEKVLIQGASGGVGTFAVQIAKWLGAEVTAVTSTRNQEQARLLGADHWIDYTRQDFTRSGQTYDVIFAANGYHSIFDYRRALTPTGRYVMAGGKPAQMFQTVLLGPLLSRSAGKRIQIVTFEPNLADLETIRGLLETKKIVSVIDRRFPFRELPEALRYLGTNHARGKVVISMPSANE